MDTILAQLPQFTLPQFLQTWVFLSLLSFVALSDNYDRWLRSLPWLALWIVGTPVRPLHEDIIWMAACWLSTELVFNLVRNLLAAHQLKQATGQQKGRQ